MRNKNLVHSTDADIMTKAMVGSDDFRVLSLSIYKEGIYDCTLNGVTHRFPKDLFVICPEGNWLASEVIGRGYPILRPFDRDIGGRYRVLVECGLDGVIIPGWSMFGGNYATGDSRFSSFISTYPLPVHDRYEK